MAMSRLKPDASPRPRTPGAGTWPALMRRVFDLDVLGNIALTAPDASRRRARERFTLWHESPAGTRHASIDVLLQGRARRRRGISRTMPGEVRCEQRLSNDEAAGQSSASVLRRHSTCSSAAFHRRSSSAATSRFRASTAWYCSEARRASYSA
jgi:hypothetical protein